MCRRLGGGGRGSDKGSIIGDVINHGKKQYWLRGGNFHYHMGLRAGENTLEAQLARLLTRTITTTCNNIIKQQQQQQQQQQSAAAAAAAAAAAGGGHASPLFETLKSTFLSDYVTFMTTPGSHNDTYASTAHRQFFANFVQGLPLGEWVSE